MWMVNLVGSIGVLNLLHNLYIYGFKKCVVQNYLKRHHRWIELDNFLEFRKFKLSEKTIHMILLVYFLAVFNFMNFSKLQDRILYGNILFLGFMILVERYVNYRLGCIRRNL